MMRSRFAAACLLASSLCSRWAFAEPTPTEIAVARRLFEEATELEGRSEWTEARAKLTEAVGVKETPGLRFHLGYCAEQLGEFVAALLQYDRAVDLIRAGATAPDVARQLEPAKARVEGKIAK